MKLPGHLAVSALHVPGTLQVEALNVERTSAARMKDVGKPKAEVAAARVMARVAGVTVTPHFCRIEDKPLDFYEAFHVIILGLDSLEARRFMNQVACSFLGAGLQGCRIYQVACSFLGARLQDFRVSGSRFAA